VHGLAGKGNLRTGGIAQWWLTRMSIIA
jgi:hypothetical protein